MSIMFSLYLTQIEEYSTHVEEVGGIGNSFYHYVIEMVIQPQ